MFSRYQPTSSFQTITTENKKRLIVLGIDPGLANTGWGVVEVISQQYRPVSFGVIKTDTSHSLPDRISAIAKEVGVLVDRYSCEVVSMEDIFFTKNVSSAISVAKVIGAICHEMRSKNIEVHLFSPPQIKQAVTGMGKADKNQVQQMVKLLLGMKSIPKSDHAADALADCITYAVFSQTYSRIGMKGNNS